MATSKLSTWLKVCGVQKLDNARELAGMELDALGINRHKPSTRYVKRSQAKRLTQEIHSVRDDVLVVGVFVNETLDFLRNERDIVGYDALQLHGDESPELTNKVAMAAKTIKAFQVKEDDGVDDIDSYRCWAYLLDAYHPEQYGGTGETAPWERIQDWVQDQRIILAGGLTPENVTEAIKTVKPWGVDVCSGVEDENCFKDIEKVRKMIRAIQGIQPGS